MVSDMADVRSYSIVTASYWGFTLTDGALRMLVLLFFNSQGFTPIDLAKLFILYEFMGVITNLFGGWLGAKYGLTLTLYSGLGLQVIALIMLAFLPPDMTIVLSITYVMTSQALSGIAKDLTKMCSKSAIKFVVAENDQKLLYKWVSLLTGSKNALKGVGFFLGGLLLQLFGFQTALFIMACGLLLILVVCSIAISGKFGTISRKVKFTEIFSKSREINLLSAARVFLFCSRDVWFVVGLPVFLVSQLKWDFEQTGGFMALWVIGYGIVQALVPKFLKHIDGTSKAARFVKIWGIVLAVIPLLIAVGINESCVGLNISVSFTFNSSYWLIIGLMFFGIVFAINSAIHSYLIVGYADRENVSLNIGFYYMANAFGRCLGTMLSGMIYQLYGLVSCLVLSTVMIIVAVAFTIPLSIERQKYE
jgi:predicted MFS family arabinose efflux permease